MLTLSATLSAAQKLPTRTPYLVATVVDQPCEIPRLDWELLVSDATYAEYHHAIGLMPNGRIIRARSTAAGGLWAQSLTDPTDATQLATWTQIVANGNLAAAHQIALMSKPGSNVVRIFYIDPTTKIIRFVESTNGTTWSAPAVVINEVTVGWTIEAVAAPTRGGSNYCFYALNKGGATPDTWLVSILNTAGVWGGRLEHNQARYTVNDLTCDYDAVTGFDFIGVCDGSPRRISFQEWNEGTAAWGGGTTLTDTSAGATFDFRAVHFIHSDGSTAGALSRHIYQFVDEATAAPTFERAMLGFTPQRSFLTELVPFSVENVYGFKLLYSATYWYLQSAQRLYRAPVYTGAAGQKLDVSADVVAFDLISPEPNKPSRALLRLQNAGGGYATLGLAAGAGGANYPLREGSQVTVKMGLATSAGNEALYQEPLWIDRIAWLDERGEGRLELELIDAWEYLSRWRVTRQTTFVGFTIRQLLHRCIWRVCQASLAATGALSDTVPSFTCQPGEDYAGIVRQLCRMAGVALRFYSYQSATDGAGFASVLVEAIPLGTGASSYSYGSTLHPWTVARHTIGGQTVGQVEVFGTAGTVFSDVLDTDYSNDVWHSTQAKVVDLLVDSNAKAGVRDDAELRRYQMDAAGGNLEGPANLAQQIADVVDLTDPRANLSATLRTVTGRRLQFERDRKFRLDHRLTLGNAV